MERGCSTCLVLCVNMCSIVEKQLCNLTRYFMLLSVPNKYLTYVIRHSIVFAVYSYLVSVPRCCIMQWCLAPLICAINISSKVNQQGDNYISSSRCSNHQRSPLWLLYYAWIKQNPVTFSPTQTPWKCNQCFHGKLTAFQYLSNGLSWL